MTVTTATIRFPPVSYSETTTDEKVWYERLSKKVNRSPEKCLVYHWTMCYARKHNLTRAEIDRDLFWPVPPEARKYLLGLTEKAVEEGSYMPDLD